ncbi:hypothetical protein BGZ94_009783 [Podila epigama]|nr:hypothetical protein BGZ94_009783 [Podila epigama]
MSSTTSLCSSSSTSNSVRVCRSDLQETITSPRRLFADEPGPKSPMTIEGSSESTMRMSSNRFGNPINTACCSSSSSSNHISNGANKKSSLPTSPSGLRASFAQDQGQSIASVANHCTRHRRSTLPTSSQSPVQVVAPSQPPPQKPKVTVATVAAVAATTKQKESHFTSSKGPLPPPPPPSTPSSVAAKSPLEVDQESLRRVLNGLSLQDLPDEQLRAQVVNLFGIVLNLHQKIERLEKSSQAGSRKALPKTTPSMLPPAPRQPLPKIPEKVDILTITPEAAPAPPGWSFQNDSSSSSSSSSTTTANEKVTTEKERAQVGDASSMAPTLLKTNNSGQSAFDIECPNDTKDMTVQTHGSIGSTTQGLDQDQYQGQDHQSQKENEEEEKEHLAQSAAAAAALNSDLKAEIQRDLETYRTTLTALLTPAVTSLIQSSSFPRRYGKGHPPMAAGHPSLDGTTTKAMTSPVSLTHWIDGRLFGGHVEENNKDNSITLPESSQSITASTSPESVSTKTTTTTMTTTTTTTTGNKAHKSGAVSDQIVYPFALRSNPILLTRGLKVVQSDAASGSCTKASSEVEQHVVEPALKSVVALQDNNNGNVDAPVSITENVLDPSENTQDKNTMSKANGNGSPQNNNNKTSSSSSSSPSSSTPPPRPQRPEVSADLGFLMTVFHSQLIALEESWLQRAETPPLSEAKEDDDNVGQKTTSDRDTTTCKAIEVATPAAAAATTETSTDIRSTMDKVAMGKAPSQSLISKSSTQCTATTATTTETTTAASATLSAPQMDQMEHRQKRLEHEVQTLMDMLTGHALLTEEREHMKICHHDDKGDDNGRCDHIHHHPRHYRALGDNAMDGIASINEENVDNGQRKTAMRHPSTIQASQHPMDSTITSSQPSKQASSKLLSTSSSSSLSSKDRHEMKAEILEGSGHSIETKVVSTIRTTTAHTTAIELPQPTFPQLATVTATPIAPVQSVPPVQSQAATTKTNKSSTRKRPPRPLVTTREITPVPPSSSLAPSATPHAAANLNKPTPPTPTQAAATNRDMDMSRQVAVLQRSHLETQRLHAQIDQFWDRLQVVEKGQRGSLWQERYHELHERLLEMELWKNKK